MIFLRKTIFKKKTKLKINFFFQKKRIIVYKKIIFEKKLNFYSK